MITSVKCERCGEEFERSESYPNKRFCSEKCRHAAKNEKAIANRSEARAQRRKTTHRGTEFKIRNSDQKPVVIPGSETIDFNQKFDDPEFEAALKREERILEDRGMPLTNLTDEMKAMKQEREEAAAKRASQ